MILSQITDAHYDEARAYIDAANEAEKAQLKKADDQVTELLDQKDEKIEDAVVSLVTKTQKCAYQNGMRMGANEGRRQWRKQAEVSPVKQGASQASFASAERRPC